MKREVVIFSLLVCASLTLAAGRASAGVESILGKWTAKAITPMGPLELELEIKMEGAQLVGTLVGFQESVPLSNLKFEDPNLSLEVSLAGATFKLSGILKDGKFDGKYEQVGAELKGPWTAERKATPPLMPATAGAISGLWSSVAVTHGGELAFKMDLKQEGEKVTGTLGSDMGIVPLQAASFKEGKLQFNIDLGPNAYHVEADLKEDKFNGKWSAVGGPDSGAFTASRQAAALVQTYISGAADLGGIWVTTAVTPDGDALTFDIELKQAGEALSGNAVAPEGKVPIQKGTFANNEMTFEIEYGGATYKIQAALADGKLAGKWSALNSPDTGAWSAVRKQR